MRHAIHDLTDDEMEAVRKVLLSRTLQMLIGAEEWDLTEEEEIHLWGAIRRLEDAA